MTPGLLEGVRVLDLTQFFSGPQATLFLAGLGAEVIRIDNPTTGDRLSSAPPFVGPEGVSLERQTEQDLGLAFLKRCRAKKSITLDLKYPEGKRIFLELVDWADVLVENFSVGVTERLGIDWPALSERNPRLIYCSITGYGATGPDRHLKAYDVMAQAASGMMSITGHPGGPPAKAGSALADSIAGSFGFAGVLGALYHRERTGRGQFVDVAMVDCMFALLFDEPLDCYETLGMPFRQGNRIPRLSPFDTFKTADGWVVIGVAGERDWLNLLATMGREDLKSDPNFMDVSWRLRYNATVTEVVSAWTETVTTAEAITRLRARGVSCGPINDIEDLKRWPHLRERDMLNDLEHTTLGPLHGVKAPGFPVKFSETPGAYDAPAALTGTHNREVYLDLLRLDEAEFDELKAKGVI